MFVQCVLQREHELNVEAILYGKCSVFMPCLLTEQQLAQRLALPLVLIHIFIFSILVNESFLLLFVSLDITNKSNCNIILKVLF